jgi:hypothetical protein
MRALTISAIVLISLGFTSLSAPSAGFAQEVCRCQGCGCKGGPGWRGPDGTCVSTAKLAEICGTPAGTPCTQEAAARVCFGKQS